MIIIPIDTSKSAHFTLSVNLDEIVCNFRFLWNLRDECWYCDFSSSNGENHGVKIVTETDLLGYKNNLGAEGDFRVLKANKTADDDITYDNFGNDYILVWGTYSEWEDFDGVQDV